MEVSVSPSLAAIQYQSIQPIILINYLDHYSEMFLKIFLIYAIFGAYACRPEEGIRPPYR